MLQTDLINKFLEKEVIAVVGVSRKGDVPANEILKKFKSSGYKAYPVNPKTEEIKGETCYANLADIPEKVDAVLFGAPPDASKEYIDQCKELGVPIVWMHRGIGKGSYSEEATELFQKEGIEVITNGCPFMFLKPVDPFHGFLKWVKKF